jgi:acyl carrier protein
MDLTELKTTVREFVLSNFYVADQASVTDAMSLLDQGIIDSTGVLEVIGFIETTLGVTVEDHEMLPENLESIERIARYVSRKQAQTAPVQAAA